MGKLIDLTNQKFGRLTVLEKTDKKKNNDILWKCQCECGKICEVRGFFLRSGQTKSCGCYKHDININKKSPILIDLTGQKFGHWTVLEQSESDKHGASRWLCECDCPAHTKRIVYGASLRKGLSVSCGCERRSHGELKIADILFQNNIFFIQEYKPFKFSTGSWASFDFFIDNRYLLEFDGIQHFSSNHGWNTENNLTKTHERDIIKNQWCKENNIPLIRIPYTRLNDLCLEDLLLETSQFII